MNELREAALITILVCLKNMLLKPIKNPLMLRNLNSVHYGHSCLIPVDQTSDLKKLYVFVDIKMDSLHFVNNIKAHIKPESSISLVSTIQFVATLQAVASELRQDGYTIFVPQVKPLSPGEILGCTSPAMKSDCLIYLGDGRFHLESAMIANPDLQAYRYDPYSKIFSREYYDHKLMKSNRSSQIERAKEAQTWGVILGTLGRQGHPRILEFLEEQIIKSGRKVIRLLLSEIFPQKLALMDNQVDAWVQIACPRLSIDWGMAFNKPLLTPFEASVALKHVEWNVEKNYPMDFYSNGSKGKWGANFKDDSKKCQDCKCQTNKSSSVEEQPKTNEKCQ